MREGVKMLMKRINGSGISWELPGDFKSTWAMAVRLKQVEDILGEGYDLDRLRELVEADREGRCVVLPCKVGDTIYDISLAEIKESNVISISFIASKSTYHVSVCAENYRHAITLDIEIGDFGKTVFLTREEAEAALEEMKNG